MTIGDKPIWTGMAQRTTVLLTDVGSRGFGLNFSSSDHDHKAICVEDYSAHVRLHDRFETIEEKYGVDVDPNFPQGRDVQYIALDKFIKMVLTGNPTMLVTLYGKPLFADKRGTALQSLAKKILSRKAGHAYLGFMEKELKRLTSKTMSRPELVLAHGFDTKQMYHILRLGMQGVELLEDGKMTLPFKGDRQEFLMEVRKGEISLQACLSEAGNLQRRLKGLIDTTSLPTEPDYTYVDTFVRSMYWDTWKGNDQHELLFRKGEFGTSDHDLPTLH